MAMMKNQLYKRALRKIERDPVFRMAVLIIVEDLVDKAMAEMKERKNAT
jgi:hypothetical protein